MFLWLLIKANVKDHDFQKHNIPRGSLATSYESIANATGLSVMSVRRVIADLVETKEIERTVYNHYQVIKIVNYDSYQGCSQRTGKQQSSEQPVEQADNNNIRMIRMKKNEKNKKGRFAPVPPPGFSDRSYAETMPPMDEGTVDDIPAEFKDQFSTYEEYWRFRNR